MEKGIIGSLPTRQASRVKLIEIETTAASGTLAAIRYARVVALGSAAGGWAIPCRLTVQVIDELAAEFVQLGGHRPSNRGEELSRRLHFGAPLRVVDREHAPDRIWRNLEAGEIDICRMRHDADRGLDALRAAVNPIYDPLQHAHVLAVARPE